MGRGPARRPRPCWSAATPPCCTFTPRLPCALPFTNEELFSDCSADVHAMPSCCAFTSCCCCHRCRTVRVCVFCRLLFLCAATACTALRGRARVRIYSPPTQRVGEARCGILNAGTSTSGKRTAELQFGQPRRRDLRWMVTRSVGIVLFVCGRVRVPRRWIDYSLIGSLGGRSARACVRACVRAFLCVFLPPECALPKGDTINHYQLCLGCDHNTDIHLELWTGVFRR